MCCSIPLRGGGVTTFSVTTLSIMTQGHDIRTLGMLAFSIMNLIQTLSINDSQSYCHWTSSVIVQSDIKLSVAFSSKYAECRYAECCGPVSAGSQEEQLSSCCLHYFVNETLATIDSVIKEVDPRPPAPPPPRPWPLGRTVVVYSTQLLRLGVRISLLAPG
jgi:hypothetical protein